MFSKLLLYKHIYYCDQVFIHQKDSIVFFGGWNITMNNIIHFETYITNLIIDIYDDIVTTFIFVFVNILCV